LSAVVTNKNYDIVRSVEELKNFWDRMVAENKPIGFDIETGYHGEDDDRGSLKMETNLLVGFSFTNSLNWARYVPLAHDFAENINDHVAVAEILWNAFQSGLLVCHNAGFELRRMARFFRELLWDHPLYGLAVRESEGYFPVRSDTQVEAYIAREYQEFGLKELVLQKFGHQMTKFDELFESLTEKKRKAFRFNILDLTAKVIAYACEDSLWCLGLHLDTYPKVKDQLVYKIDMEIVYVICEMEDCGIRYDWFFMQEASNRAKDFTAKLNDEIQSELADMLGMPGTKLNVNLGSPKQLSEILFDRLGLKVNVFTTSTKGAAKEDKKMSTGKQALEILAKDNPIAAKIGSYKNMKRLTTSFLDKYPKDYGNSPDGMIHPSLNQSYVRTARFSSANPNQQNQPSINLKDDDGKTPLSYYYKLNNGESYKLNFRDSVIAPDDFYILGFDLSQAEYRAVAGLANETAMIEAFESGTDIHEFVARMMFKIPEGEKVPKHLRSRAKTIGFGLLFGMTASALAKRLNCSIEEAEELFAQYFSAFPRLKRYTEKQVEFGYEHGYVTTKFGRVIPIWELQDSRRWIREGGERACYNYPVQGGATGDYVRIGMVRARKAIHKAGLKGKVKLFMNVHDALEFYVHRSLNPADVIRLLQPCVIFPVPGWPMMKADWHIGKRWGSVKEVELLENGDIKIEDGPVVSPGTTYLPTLEDEAQEPVAEETEEGDEGTWSHCGNSEPHAEHKHDVSFNEGTYKDVPCKGTPGTTYLPTLQTEEPTKHLIVEIQHMPTGPQFNNFLRIVEKLKGSSTVELKTPEGILDLEGTTGIDPSNAKHVGVVSLALGGAKMRFAAQDVDLAALANDIAF
jgi:DNA polymerase I-like protein with 3'-5' exonuclease and polymerase domains